MEGSNHFKAGFGLMMLLLLTFILSKYEVFGNIVNLQYFIIFCMASCLTVGAYKKFIG